MKYVKTWPRWQQAWFYVMVVGFFIFGAVFSYQNGNHEFHRTDGATEQMLLHATKVYADDGFMKYWLLPEYPPFGFDGEGNPRVVPFVYTHYFPGPAWVMGVLRKTIGENGIWITRLVPLSMNVLGLAFLGIEFSLFMGASIAGLILMSALLTSRAITIFSVSLAGHGYVMAIYLFSLGLLFWFLRNQKAKALSSKALLYGLLIGFLQIEFSIDFVMVTFLSCLGLAFLLKDLSLEISKKFLIGMILGGILGMLLQVTLFSLHLGSVAAALEDFTKWGSWRMGIYKFHTAEVLEDYRLSRVLREYNRQAYGATGFTAWNMVFLSAFFIVLGKLTKVFSELEIKRASLGLVATYLAAISWNVLMRQHSFIHIHFIPRHYIVLFVYMMMMCLLVSSKLITHSQRAQKALKTSA